MKKFMKVVSLICVMLVLCLSLPVFTSTNAVGERVGIDCYYNNDGDAEASLAFSNFTYDFKAYFAIYDNSGKLLKISSKDIVQNVILEKLIIPMDDILYGVDYKVFIWNYDTLNPVRDFFEGKLTSKASLNEENFLKYINGNTVSPQGLREVLLDCYKTKIIDVKFDVEKIEDDLWLKIYDSIISNLYFDITQFENYLLEIYDKLDPVKTHALAVVVGTSVISSEQKKIQFFQNGVFLSYVVSEDCDDLSGIGVGDIFQYTLAGDEIFKANIIAEYKNSEIVIVDKNGGDIGNGQDTDTIKYIEGKVTDKETKYIVVDGSEYTFANSDEVGTVAVYNTARSGKNAVTALTSLSSLKKSGATYTYNVIARLEDNKIVDAIEYQTQNYIYPETTATPAPATATPAPDPVA
ncbi:MAG: hypothetical protein IKW59_08790 [Clostridia bacterium]|nr:hypothetical protein [Clostridia bacterium]